MKKILLATLLLLGGCARAVNPISEPTQRPEEMDIDPTVEQGGFYGYFTVAYFKSPINLVMSDSLPVGTEVMIEDKHYAIQAKLKDSNGEENYIEIYTTKYGDIINYEVEVYIDN